MSGWRDVTLGDVCELKRGYDLPNGSRKNGRIPVVSSSGPTGRHDEAKVSAPGVVTGRYGTLGGYRQKCVSATVSLGCHTAEAASSLSFLSLV